MRSIAALAVLAALAGPSPALADRKHDADALFKKGKRLQADQKYAQACVAFEESDKLDPAIGTKLNAAKCYEEWGRLARAHRWYTAAEQMAASSEDDRLPKIRELIETLDPDVPRLTVNVPAGMDPADVEAAAIMLDGKPVPATDLGVAVRLDPGPHELVYLVDGAKKSKLVPLERGGERELLLDIPKGAAQRRAIAEGKADPPRPGRTRRIIGISMGAAGLAGIGVASYLTLDARSSYNDALDAHCAGMANACSPEGLAITKDARSQANLATVITLASVAVIGGGVFLYLTAPDGDAPAERRAVYVTPVVSGDGGGLVVGGGF